VNPGGESTSGGDEEYSSLFYRFVALSTVDTFSRAADGADPRTTGEHVRELSGPVTLVGVVHDHPASTHRVRRVVADVDPDVLALELPPVEIPLFERYAGGDRVPPTFGGEMSAAIQADDVGAVGIDRPAAGFGRRLVRAVLRERPSAATVRTVLRNVVSVTTHAVVDRLAAVAAGRLDIRLEVASPVAHDTDRRDSPAAQARDERKRGRWSRTFTNSFATPASRFEDDVREAHMADRLAALAAEGAVVAVVGIEHFDPLAERLDEERRAPSA
jgi:hypothetical protein